MKRNGGGDYLYAERERMNVFVIKERVGGF